jgi:hypothetical protein
MALKPAKVGGAGIAHEARGRYRGRPPLDPERKATERRDTLGRSSKIPLEVEPGSARVRYRRGGGDREYAPNPNLKWTTVP